MTLEISILVALRNVHPRMLPEAALRGDAGAMAGEAVTAADCQAKCRKLEAKGQVIGVSNEDTGAKWKITADGIARLAEAGY